MNNGRDFYTFAEALFANDLDETHRRVLIGRYYYGAFHVAREQAGIAQQSASEHQTVIDHYAPRNSRLSNNLDDLRRLRTKSDYKLATDVSFADLRDSRRMSTFIIQTLENE